VAPLLGTSGLINAYREAAAEALRNAEIIECLVKDVFRLDFDYALMPDVMNALKKLELEVLRQSFEDRGQIDIGIRQSETAATLLRFRAQLWKVSEEEAEGVGWPSGLTVAAV
jgi:putative IMPACT (imprinted ancient) family translation regulator